MADKLIAETPTFDEPGFLQIWERGDDAIVIVNAGTDRSRPLCERPQVTLRRRELTFAINALSQIRSAPVLLSWRDIELLRPGTGWIGEGHEHWHIYLADLKAGVQSTFARDKKGRIQHTIIGNDIDWSGFSPDNFEATPRSL